MHLKKVLFTETGRAIWADTIYAPDVPASNARLGIYVYYLKYMYMFCFSCINFVNNEQY